jgi:hypothetical protein
MRRSNDLLFFYELNAISMKRSNNYLVIISGPINVVGSHVDTQGT